VTNDRPSNPKTINGIMQEESLENIYFQTGTNLKRGKYRQYKKEIKKLNLAEQKKFALTRSPPLFYLYSANL